MTSELQRLCEESSMPILCIHGSNDAGIPYEVSTKIIQKLVPRVKVKLYEGAAHIFFQCSVLVLSFWEVVIG